MNESKSHLPESIEQELLLLDGLPELRERELPIPVAIIIPKQFHCQLSQHLLSINIAFEVVHALQHFQQLVSINIPGSVQIKRQERKAQSVLNAASLHGRVASREISEINHPSVIMIKRVE